MMMTKSLIRPISKSPSFHTIASFFKPVKGPAAAKEGGGAESKDTAGTELSQQSEHLQVTLAFHSVILVEEVDILFEDDKGFWSAMYDIINMSKRPIILTCNDPHLQLECHHNVIDMCRPSEQELVNHLQVIALSHDLLLPGIYVVSTAPVWFPPSHTHSTFLPVSCQHIRTRLYPRCTQCLACIFTRTRDYRSQVSTVS
ncbi:uncharacterized protein [Dysidea avara]|uniref:uncharacterized protein n=1 Tax=Dysidea avara TaxID=196820 RepID=UPI0033274B2E